MTRAWKLALVALRALISAAVAAGLTQLISSRLPRSLDVTTDVVGYPIFADFNVDRYLWIYVLWVAFFPLAAVAIDMALSRLTRSRLRGPASAPRPRPATDNSDSTRATPGVELFRTAFVGLVLGVEVSIGWDRSGRSFLLVCLITTVLYVAIALRIAALAERFRGRSLSYPERLAAVNIFASLLTVVGLYSVSKATKMEVLATGNVHGYPWFPLWLALLLTACLVAVAVVGMRRAAPRIHALERRFILLVPAPILLLLVLAELPGELGPIDFFHEGEGLAAAQLTADGAVPWRDLMFIHGLLHDILIPTFSLGIFGNTRWGGAAGASVLIFPIYWLSQYFLFVYLFGRNVLFLIGTQVAVVLGLIHHAHLRFLLLPFALLLLAAVLNKATWPRMAGLAAVIGAQAVVTPEATIFLPACFAVLVFFELSSYDRRLPFRLNFRRTLGTAAAGLVLLGVFALVLASLHALDDFVFFYRTFAPDHSLTGGIPLIWLDTSFKFAAIAPVVVVILAIWFFAVALRTRRSPAVADWVMGALAITVLLYYPKFLARPDIHVYQPYAVAVPLIAYAVYRVVGLLENRLAQFRLGRGSLPTRHWLTAAALVVVALASPRGILDTAEAIPGRLSSAAHNEPVQWRLGYLSPFAIDLAVFSDIERTLERVLEPGDRFFDLSNNPMLFHYMLDRRPSTRYFHVSMAIRKHTQADLVAELERHPPKLVAFSSSPVIGLPWWDSVANQVRHYDVSEYILDHYRPVLTSHTFVLMARNDLDRPVALPTADQLYFANIPCDWGYAPNFLDTRPETQEIRRAVSVPFTPMAGGRRLSLELPAQAGRRFDWLEIRTGSSFVENTLGVTDQPGQWLRTISFKTLDRGQQSLWIQVGACSQWHGFRGNRLFLESAADQPISKVRLVP
jgi:hypothetical protein